MVGAEALRIVAIACMALVAIGCGGDEHRSPADAGAGDADAPSHDAGPDAANSGCRNFSCRAPATCVATPDAHCACPSGYDDPKHDGSQCVDIDECADAAKNSCDRHSNCTNTLGSSKCECKGPAYVGDGKRCDCGKGYTRDSVGNCLADNGHECDDNLDCMNGHCVSGICCAQACSDPEECQTTDGATCSDGTSCKYPRLNDGEQCDDLKACTAISTCQKGVCVSGSEAVDCDDHNPCTDDSCVEPVGCKNRNNTATCDDHNSCTKNDRCRTGVCAGDAVDCSGSDDVCNLGECDRKNGACIKRPRAGQVACNDDDSCTSNDSCNAGTCMGNGSACGTHVQSCVEGTPNMCTCSGGFVDNTKGRCVPMNDECANASRCSPNADCMDPSSSANDVVCTCKPGFSGDGNTCTAVDPCANNPCGASRGTCTAGDNGTHTCACNIGYVPMGDTCVCDMTGTFAIRTRLQVRWPTLSTIEGGEDAWYSYAIERHRYDNRGNLMLELTACGETSIDACGVGVSPVLAAEAYSTFLPVDIWDMPSMPVLTTKVSAAKPLPGSSFTTDQVVALMGIGLADPMGEWPSKRADIAGTPWFDGTAVNGATWLDQDNDTFVGITSYVVPPGGIRADGVPPDPIHDFGAISAVCPRGGGNHSRYEYWPVPGEGFSLTPIRIKRFYTASRVISSLKGTINSCDDISGDVTGPDNGLPKLDGRTGGCVRTQGSSEVNCSSTTIDFLDMQLPANAGQEILSFTFKSQRVAGPVTCAMVRDRNFDE